MLWHPWFPPTCNRCDGDHASSQCPHFLADRDADEDAWLHYGNVPEASQADGNNIFLRDATVLRQPGDGHCLFHSLGAGLQDFGETISGESLRRDITQFLFTHADESYGGNTWTQWIHKDSQMSVGDYCALMLGTRHWGGNLEIAAFTVMHNINVHVFVESGNEFRRTSCVHCPTDTDRKLCVLYVSNAHYDLLTNGVLHEEAFGNHNDANDLRRARRSKQETNEKRSNCL